MGKLLLFIVSFLLVTSCKTYEGQVKFQEQGNLLNYYDKIKQQSVKDLEAIASQMRTNRITFEDSKNVDNILRRKNVTVGFGSRMQKVIKDQEKEPVKLNEFELKLTEEFFEFLDESKDFEEVKLFLNSKVKQVVETGILNEREKKKLIIMISSVITGGDFIKDNVDLLAAHEEIGENELIGKKVKLGNNKVAERRGVQFNRRCFRYGGRVFESRRCPAYTTLIGRDRHYFKSCCKITNSSLTRYLGVIWAVALVEPTPLGEAAAGIITAGIGLYLVHRATHRPHCIAIYVKRCKRPSPCASCLQFCVTQGYWDFHNCPLK